MNINEAVYSVSQKIDKCLNVWPNYADRRLIPSNITSIEILRSMKIDIILIFIFRNVREQMARSLVKLKEYEKQVNFFY